MVSGILKACIPAALLAASVCVWADDPADGTKPPPAPAPPPPPLTVKAQVGYVSSHGDTNAQTGNAKISVIYNAGDWKHDLELAGLYGKSNDIVSAERFVAGWQSNYNFSSRMFTFGALDYNDDKFSGFQYQETVSTGLGYSIVKLADATLDAQVGVGYRRLRPELLVTQPDGDVTRTPLDQESGTVATATIKGMYAFNSSTKLLDVLAAQSGSDNTMVQNDLNLQVNMSKALAITAGYEIIHNTSPPAGLTKNDTLVTFNLTYAFPTSPGAANP
jgi:putative salt-induced outer membrane protein